MRAVHRAVRESLPERGGEPPLVHRVGPGEEQGHRERFGVERRHRIEHARRFRLVQRRHHPPERVGAFGDLDHPGARHQRFRLRGAEIVGMRPPLAAERQHVAEARRGEQDDPAAGPGEPRVGGDGESVQQQVEPGRGRSGPPRYPADALDDRPRRPGRRRHLVDERTAAGVVDQDEVGEGAPDIDGKPHRCTLMQPARGRTRASRRWLACARPGTGAAGPSPPSGPPAQWRDGSHRAS